MTELLVERDISYSLGGLKRQYTFIYSEIFSSGYLSDFN